MNLTIIIVCLCVLVSALVILALLLWFINKREERGNKNANHYKHDVIIRGGADVVSGQLKSNDHRYFNGMKEYDFDTVCFQSDHPTSRGQISGNRTHSVVLDCVENGLTFKCDFVNEIIIGRQNVPGSLVITNDNTVSGKHCRIYVMNNSFYVEDLGSANHTYLNRNAVLGPVQLKNQDYLKIGRNTFRVYIY